MIAEYFASDPTVSLRFQCLLKVSKLSILLKIEELKIAHLLCTNFRYFSIEFFCLCYFCAVEGGISAKPEASNTEISKRNPKLLTVRYERSHLAEFSHQQLSQPTVTDINKICWNYFTNWILCQISFIRLFEFSMR